jgi:hypothetical protein
MLARSERLIEIVADLPLHGSFEILAEVPLDISPGVV